MLTLTELSSDVPTDHVDPLQTRNAIAFLKQALLVSIFVMDHGDRQDLLNHIKTLPASVQTVWGAVVQQTLFETSLRKARCSCNEMGNRSLALRVTTISEPQAICNQCNQESAWWSGLMASSAVQAAMVKRVNAIPAGANRQEIFDDCISPLVLTGNELLIVDRYVGRNLPSPGLQWLLTEVWEISDLPVLLVTATDVDTSKATIVSRITDDVRRARRAVKRPGVVLNKKMGVWVTSDNVFMNHSHDRFISTVFGTRLIGVSFGKGLSIFDASSLSQLSTTQTHINDPAVSGLLRALGMKRSNIAWV